ncbi:MAG: DUF4421 family protein [Salibacteraceae bacterium]
MKLDFKGFSLRILMFMLLVTGLTFKVEAQVVDSLEAYADRFGHYLLFRNQDTSYISNFGNEFGVKLVAMNKFNYFSIMDFENGTRVRYNPARDLYLGVGFAYKWIAVDLTMGLNLYKNSDFKYQKAFDFQGRIYSSKHFFSGTIQYYRGYKLNLAQGNDSPLKEEERIREDMRTTNIDLQYLYAVNYTKFSLKAPFVLNEVQEKSAGSVIIGAGFNSYSMYADSSIIPVSLSSDFSSSSNLTSLDVLSIGINAGYMYTLVLKHNFFITASLIPGIHFYFGDYSNPDLKSLNSNVNVKLISMNSLGYNGRRVFGGVNFSYNGMLVGAEKKLYNQLAFGKLSVFVGYRFKSKKDKLKKN